MKFSLRHIDVISRRIHMDLTWCTRWDLMKTEAWNAGKVLIESDIVKLTLEGKIVNKN